MSEINYTYTYDNGKLVRAAESGITVNGDGTISGKTLKNSVLYIYDKDGNPIKKRIKFADGSEHIVYFENSDDKNTVAKLKIGDTTVTSHSKTDSFGRKIFDELQIGKGFVSRQFTYHQGETTAQHTENSKLKSTPTTELVKEILFDDGRTLEYEYDAEERITKVTDSVDGITEYTYDALGQLLTETKNGTVVNTMTYDGYGNILTKNGKTYTYGNTAWKDLLTAYDGQTITYDAQGNPTSYLGHNLTWEKGRQLKSFDSNIYTYNANGIRTSKTVNGVLHSYTLDGAKLRKESWANNSIVPLYDNEDSVCGIIYNDVPYYFYKNLQGDIISIVNTNDVIVAKYSYDAWGVPTITEDTSDCNIATVNPYRYRGYYYDTEISIYYLYSRYYDPEIGRFINSDSVETLEKPIGSQFLNLYSYCHNNPINETDLTGMFLASKLAEIFLSAVFGMIAQLFNDLVIYFLRILVHGQKNVRFSPNPSDYVSSALSWAFECINPFSGKKKILNVIFAVLPVIVKTIWDLVSGRGFDLWSFLRNIFYALLSVIVRSVLGIKTKNRIAEIKKKYGRKKPAFRAQKMQIKARYTILGNRITTTINIAAVIVETVLDVIFI